LEKRICKLVFDPNDPNSVSRTQQHFAKDLDINNIMKRYDKTGVLPTHGGTPFYGDFSAVPDLAECLNKVTSAMTGFENLPIEIKKKFNQDPIALVDFVSDPKNLKESVALGLLPKEALPSEPAPVVEPGVPVPEKPPVV